MVFLNRSWSGFFILNMNNLNGYNPTVYFNLDDFKRICILQ